MEYIYWDHSYNTILLVNLTIAIALFTSLRFFSGIIAHVNVSKELTQNDNPSFGISLAGVVLGTTIILTGAIYGEPIYTFEESVIAVGLYGSLGIILLALTRLIFDKLALPKLSIRDEIAKGNIAAGIIDAGNVVATSIIIYASMVWVASNTLEGTTSLLTAFLISQALLTVAVFARVKLFDMKGKDSIQQQLHNGNIALALRFTGRRIGIAFAIMAASHLMVYETFDQQLSLAIWAGISVIIMLILSLLSFIATKVILWNIDVQDEIIHQRNIAIGVVQCVIYIALGYLLSELVA